jgi:hypothetical protein
MRARSRVRRGQVRPLHIEPVVDVVVLVRAEGAWSYYVSEKEYWLLDLVMLQRGFERAGYRVDESYGDRFDIPIVDETARGAFLECMSPFRVDLRDLAELARIAVVPASEWTDVAHVFPALLVDFDARRLYSVFPEPTRFELYVPEGWTGELRDFFDEVPRELRYWVVDGVDHLIRLTGPRA